jgi:hypothetical protein
MSDVERRYHESWLGMVQPIEGLVFSVPVLVDASVMERTAPDAQEKFREHLTGDGEHLKVRDLPAFLRAVLGFSEGDFLAGDAVPEALRHYVPEGRQTITPTFVLKNPTPTGTEPRDAAELLIWQLPGLSAALKVRRVGLALTSGFVCFVMGLPIVPHGVSIQDGFLSHRHWQRGPYLEIAAALAHVFRLKFSTWSSDGDKDV